MSSSTPGPARRRRIAGERRTGRPAAAGSTTRSAADPAATSSEHSSATSSAPTSATIVAEPPAPAEAREPSARRAPRFPRPLSARTSAARPRTAPRPERQRPSGRLGAWWGSRTSLAVFGAVIALSLVIGGALALGLFGNRGVADVREAQAADSAGRAASAAAERAAAAVLAYDFRTLEADESAAAKFLTDDFAEQYTGTFEKVVMPAAKDSRAKVTASVKASSVVRAAPDEVRVLLFVDQTTRSTAHQGPQVALNRVELTMVQQSGTWLVDDITSY